MRYSSAFLAGAVLLGLTTVAPVKASAGYYYNYGCYPYASYYSYPSYGYRYRYGYRGYGYGRPYYGNYWGQGRRVARRVNRRWNRWD
jgi:hypothetical protein